MTVSGVLKALQEMQPNDPYIIQQLALATYKAEVPDKIQALRKAKDILMPLAPWTSSDAETVGLWGAVHKRLWEERKEKADLDQGIRAYERGYFFKNDHYNGINLAFLLDVRASLTAGDEAVADRVRARRIRGEILDLCNQSLKSGTLLGDDAFWVLATKVEALVGLRDPDAEPELAAAVAKAPQPWMAETLVEQIDKLKALLP
jgi:hypothetical protein